MAGVRFEDVDLLGALSRIVDLHTQHYKEDFDLDKELISKLAVSSGIGQHLHCCNQRAISGSNAYDRLF